MHIDLPGGKKIPLYDSAEQEMALARKSVIKTTQEDHLKTVVLIVSIHRDNLWYNKVNIK